MANLVAAKKVFEGQGFNFTAGAGAGGGDPQDIVLGFPLDIVTNCIYLGDVNDKAAYDAYTGEDKEKRFWWCKQPFIGMAIAFNTETDDINDSRWNVTTVVGPQFVEGFPNLSSGAFRKEQVEAELDKKTIFKVRCTKGKQTRTGYDPNKRVFKPA